MFFVIISTVFPVLIGLSLRGLTQLKSPEHMSKHTVGGRQAGFNELFMMKEGTNT